jgi:hypothetical protein
MSSNKIFSGAFMVISSCKRIFFCIAFGLSITLTQNGCSLFASSASSESSGSISDSSESISDSSSSSSEDSDKDSKKSEINRYENEIKDFTVTYMRANAGQIDQFREADQNDFMKGISDVASQNGVVDWEANPKTYRGIGKGLRKAKISGYLYENYKKEIASDDPGKMDDIQEGYDN